MKRNNNQTEHITQSLKSGMLDGRYPAGSRLPTRLELQSDFGASPVTLQKVITRLAEEGFILTRGRQGTFMSETPSHLHRMGLLFELSREDVESSIFLDGLRKCASRVEQTTSLSFECFYDLKRGMAAPDAVRLMEQV
ncbi:MAG: winged helix-turn-helix domain-containing protein, partial [bacterium]